MHFQPMRASTIKVARRCLQWQLPPHLLKRKEVCRLSCMPLSVPCWEHQNHINPNSSSAQCRTAKSPNYLVMESWNPPDQRPQRDLILVKQVTGARCAKGGSFKCIPYLLAKKSIEETTCSFFVNYTTRFAAAAFPQNRN